MKPIELETFYDLTYLSTLNVSDSGELLAYMVHKADVKKNQYTSDLALRRQGKTVPLTTSGKVGKYFFEGDKIVYMSLKDESVAEKVKKGIPLTAFYALPLDGGESMPYFELPLKVIDIKAIGEGRYLVLANHRKAFDAYNEANDEEKAKLIEMWNEENDAIVVEEIPFWSNGGTYTKGARNKLFLYDQKNDQLTALTDENTSVMQFDYCGETDRLVYVSKTYEGKMPLTSDVFLGHLASKKFDPILKDEMAIYSAFLMSDQRVVLYGHDRKTYGLNQNGIFYLYEDTSKALNVLYENLSLTVGNTVGSDARFGAKRSLKKDGDCLYFISTEGFNAYLNRLSLDGNCVRLTEREGSVDDFDVKGEVLYLSAMRGNGANEIYALSDGAETQLTTYNAWLLEHDLSTPEHYVVETAPGVWIDGWVMKPTQYVEGKKYPSILNIHGGPKTVYGSVYYNEMQYFANKGYFVFFCNPRGSDGKGNAFADIRGKYGTIDYEDIMRFTDFVVEKYPAIDQENMFVTGGSYGGFMTNWIIGHTHRFKAAASQRSISNWLTEYGVTDIGYYFVPDQVASTPWERFDALWEMSPLKYANQVKTPTLFIHSDEDYRCWVPEAMQMFTALKDHEIPSKLVIFKGENHELSRGGKPKNRKRRIDEILSWFNAHQSN